jgi:hypothetical protein
MNFFSYTETLSTLKKIKMKKTQPNLELLTASPFGILVDTGVFPQIPSSLLDSGIVQIKQGGRSRLGVQGLSIPRFSFRM